MNDPIITSISISLFSLSGIITVFTLIFAFKVHLHIQFSTELLIYVLVSEVFKILSKFLFLLINDKLEGSIYIIVITIIALFLDTFEILALLVYTIKIYDAIIRQSQWFIQKKIRILSRIQY